MAKSNDEKNFIISIKKLIKNLESENYASLDIKSLMLVMGITEEQAKSKITNITELKQEVNDLFEQKKKLALKNMEESISICNAQLKPNLSNGWEVCIQKAKLYADFYHAFDDHEYLKLAEELFSMGAERAPDDRTITANYASIAALECNPYNVEEDYNFTTSLGENSKTESDA